MCACVCVCVCVCGGGVRRQHGQRRHAVCALVADHKVHRALEGRGQLCVHVGEAKVDIDEGLGGVGDGLVQCVPVVRGRGENVGDLAVGLHLGKDPLDRVFGDGLERRLLLDVVVLYERAAARRRRGDGIWGEVDLFLVIPIT